MSLKSLNSVGGFSVKNGSGDIVVIIDSNGNINTPTLTVTGNTNLGNVGNVTITGGSNGYVLTTDGAGNLTWANGGGSGGNLFITSPMPTLINVGETYYVTANHQGLFSQPIEINGAFEIEGVLEDVSSPAPSLTAAVENVIITGGSSGQYLQTDGTGNLSWAAGGGGGGGSPGGVTTQVQFNDAGSFAGNIGFTFNKTTGLLTTPYLSGNGNSLSNLAGANVTGAVSYATTANAVAGANVSGQVGNSLVAGTVYTAAQPNITSTGTLTSLSVTGNANIGNIGTGGLITATGNITGANLVTGGLITATGNITGGNIVTAGQVAIGNSNYSTSSNAIQGWSYSGVSKSILAEDTTSTGLFFKSDGNSMYVVGTTNDKVFQYNLSSAWNVSTATLYGNVSVLAQETTMNDIFINSTGANMYLVGDTGNLVYQYSLATPWDITTATYASKSFSVATQETTPTGLFFSPDLANMYVSGANSDAIFQYTLSSPGDVTTATYSGKSLSIVNQDGSSTGLAFDSSGTKAFIIGTGQYAVYQYVLSTPWDVSTGTYTAGSSYYMGYQETTPTGIYSDLGNSRFFMVGQGTDTVYQYNTNNSAIVSANAVGIQTTLDVAGNVYFSQGLNTSGAIRTASTMTVASTTSLASTVTMSTTTSNVNVGTSQTTGATIIGGTAQTGNIEIGRSTATQTVYIGFGATSNGNVKTVAIAANGAGNSNSNVTIFSSVAGNSNLTIGASTGTTIVSFTANTTVSLANTGGSALSVAGNITGGNLVTGGLITVTGNITGGNIITAGIMSSTGNATHGNLSVTGNATAGQYQVSGKQAVNGPAFSAYANATLQTITSGSQQKVLFQTEEFDTNNNYASSRFTPTVEGYYQLNAEVRLDGASGTGEIMIVIWKNGSEYKRGTNQSGTQIAANFWAMTVNSLVYANGSTDYFEIYVQQTSGGSLTVTAVNNPAITWFNGCMVRGA